MKLHCRLLFAVVCLSLCTGASVHPGDPMVTAIEAQVGALMDPEGHTIRGARIALPELIQEFYARRGFGPAWSDPALANELRKALADSYHDGLDPADYHLPLLKQLAVEADSPQATAELRAQNDILMTEGLLRLAYHLSFGKVDPESFDPQWNYGRTLAETDVIGEIDTAIASGRLYDRIEALMV